jgi:NADH-quinone oxidoreductase subunit F
MTSKRIRRQSEGANGGSQYEAIDRAMERRDYRRDALKEALSAAQHEFGYLPEDAQKHIAEQLNVPLAEVHGFVEFYAMLYNQPIGKRILRVCTDPACAVAGGEEILEAVCKCAGVRPGETSDDDSFTVERATCLGLCDQAPAVLVNETAYVRVMPGKVESLFDDSAALSTIRVTGEPRVLTRHIGAIAPTDLNAHARAGAFDALKKALTMTPEAVIEQVKLSGLVGRGGAAFPTGLKWQFTRGAGGVPKIVVCNADESEPGTFKDRAMMEGDPFRVIEGMVICGYAIGSPQGFLFIRGEYPRAAAIMQRAIDRAYEAGYLGQDILGTDSSFDIDIRRGAGAYVCGEETALFEAIEGKRGFPRMKPPFPTVHGLFGKPTCINNVETLSNIPDLIVNGGKWFTQWGTDKSTGLKLYCVSGHVKNPGVVEAPFGITLRDLIETHCGGFAGRPQMFLMGGAAGSFLLPEHLDAPLTYEDLQPLGASIGSGAVMVFDEKVDRRHVLRVLAHFFVHESCGKCYPCQLGTQRQMEILDRVAQGNAQPGDKDRLMLIGKTMTDAALCGLGQTAGTAILSALRWWPELIP